MRLKGTATLTAFLLWSACAWAHGVVGKRMFIEPLFTEDANVKNELVFPFLHFAVQPDGTWRQAAFSFEKQLYANRLSFTAELGRINRHDGEARLTGWDNLELGLKFQAYTNEKHEFLLSTALLAALPTSSKQVADNETALIPMLLYGKGFGDVPYRWLRPLAIQGDAGFTASVRSPHEKELSFNGVLMYSIPYLNHWVRKADTRYRIEHSLRRGFSRGALLGNLFPYLEFNGVRSMASEHNETLSSIRPGVAWMGKYVQVSIAADIPVQYPSAEERPHKGFCFSLDWFLDEIFPALEWTPFGKHSHHP